MKRILLVIALIFLLTGCGVSTADLTDEQSDLIAETASSLLLQGDKRYCDSYVETMYADNQAAKQDAAGTALQTDSTEQTNTAAESTEISDQATPASKTQGSSTDTANTSNANTNTNLSTTEGSSGTSQANNIAISQLATIIGIPQFNLTYQGYDIGDTYPNTVNDNVSVDFSSREGYGLLVLTFELENTTNEVQQWDLLTKNISYQLDLNGTKHAFEATVLINDLATFSDKFQPSEKKEAVLIAQIKDSELQQVDTMSLLLNKDNTQYQIPLN